MNPRRDDDALNWAGDDDPTLQAGDTDRAEPTALPEGWTIPPQASVKRPAVADDTTTTGTTDAATPDPNAPHATAASSVALVGTGILAGMYLLYTIGWFIGVARLSQSSSATLSATADPVADFMTSLGGWLAVAAPVVWFGSTFWLTMTRPRARWTFLLLGVVVLIPFPFLLGTGAPQ